MKLTTIKSIVAAALVAVGFTAVAEPVYPDRVEKVQLWEGGPYFATCNIDATTPQGFGSKAQFSQTAAVVEDRLGGLGEGWRVPTAEDMAGLINDCTCAWTENYNSTGVKGTIVTSKEDPSKSIFFPAAGLNSLITTPEGYYWTSTPGNTSDFATAILFKFENGEVDFHLNGSQPRVWEMSIRPVRDAPTPSIDEVEVVYPWDGSKGTITINYSLTNLVTRKMYKVAFDITANGRTVSVTNDAASLVEGRQPTKTIDTAALFGLETHDEAAKVKISLIEIRSPSEPDDCTTTTATFRLVPPPTVTINEVKSGSPWDGAKGTITVDYSLANIDATKEYKVAFDITANGQTASVTSDAAQLVAGRQAVKTIDTVTLFGKEVTDAEAKVKVSLIEAVPPVGQLWKDGPIWSATNLGESEVQEHPEYGGLYSFADAQSAAAELGDGWRLPTKEEFKALKNNCDWEWDNVRKGLIFKGKGGYVVNSIFLPAAGRDTGSARVKNGEEGYYWSSTEDILAGAVILDFVEDDVITPSSPLAHGLSVRAVHDAPAEPELVSSAEAEFVLGAFPEGSEENPWKIGAEGHEDEVTAWTNGVGGLIVEGTGAVASTPWTECAAGIGELVKAKGVTGLEDIVATLPALTTVNGLTLAELNGLAVGAVKADGFSAIAVDPATQEATLSVVISKAESLDESEWKPVATNDVPVKADTPAGFFILAPLAK